jgi:DNA-binding FadR family transcriptional regulator
VSDNDWQPVATSRIAYQQIADQLLEQILTGQLAVGDRLPSEAELCQQFGVGRSTIREALRVLSSRNLLTTNRGVGGGSQVAQIDHEDVSRMLGDAIILLTRSEGCTIPEVVEARELLEVPAARLAAQRRTPEQLEELRATIPSRVSASNVTECHDLGRRFHALLLELAGNRLLALMTEPVFALVGVRFEHEQAAPEFWQQVQTHHESILRAIEDGDGERAGREMAAHMVNLRSTYEAIDRLPH